jgi:GTP cyclohydrolase II
MSVAVTGPASLPLRWGATTVRFTLLHFDFPDGRWVAAYVGALDAPEPVPLRIESACFFGHVLRSQQCDCGYQLDTAMRQFAETGRGLLVYGLDQDARGLGTAAHFAIYRMRQLEHLDTAEVFERLGASWDNRSYDAVPHILRHLGVRAVTLLSNNEDRLAFLHANGVAATIEPLEAPLDVDNMSTLMLEKEDLGYRWSFETHADWLEPLQREVLDEPSRSIACLVVPGHGMADAGEVVVRGDAWDLAASVAGRVPARRRPGPLVAYLTDLPRVDDVLRYRQAGVDVIVVPFNPVPAELTRAGMAAGVRVVDWARRNAYPVERAQWRLSSRGDHFDVYRRGSRTRVVALGGRARERIAGLWQEALAAGADPAGAPSGDWFEVDAAHWPADPATAVVVEPAGASC